MSKKIVVITRRLRDEDIPSKVIPIPDHVTDQKLFAAQECEKERELISKTFVEFNHATWKHYILEQPD